MFILTLYLITLLNTFKFVDCFEFSTYKIMSANNIFPSNLCTVYFFFLHFISLTSTYSEKMNRSDDGGYPSLLDFQGKSF